MQLQRYGEELMAGKRGAIVAIEPKTGEILCLISSPNYDPNLLVGTARPKNYGKLVMDPEKPLFSFTPFVFSQHKNVGGDELCHAQGLLIFDCLKFLFLNTFVNKLTFFLSSFSRC